ncbi:MAG: glutamate-5-semialdehyde dehydrogenase [Firmicutes bacterium]|nr:glutamate-5-semialdehyde dehydrogenase [Candidatus Colimorpha enterica]
MTTSEILKKAKRVKTALALLDEEKKNAGLEAVAGAIVSAKEDILAANRKDLEAAKGRIQDSMLDRLMLNGDRIDAMADGIRELISLPDPVGRVLEERTVNKGLKLKKISVPMGVVAIIYESRPNVTSDAAALCLKSGNVAVLRGGREAYGTSAEIVKAMRSGLANAGLDPDFINMIEDTTHAGAEELMKANGFVDLLIPRGGKRLISACVQNATVPCIETGTGICSVFVDEEADIGKALDIVENAKTSRPSVCNAEETLLVHRGIAERFLPLMKKRLVDDRAEKGLTPVELRLDEGSAKIIDGKAAADEDFDTEFLDYVLAVKLVGDVDEAIEHIALHSTHHSEAIVTENRAAADRFTSAVDSAAVYVNASTRFTDGGMFGLGCEMGISTQKLHARGPMGLSELTGYKYVIEGNGQVR